MRAEHGRSCQLCGTRGVQDGAQGWGSPGRNKLKYGCMIKSGLRSPCRVMPPEIMRPTKVGRLVRKTSAESRAQEARKVKSKK